MAGRPKNPENWVTINNFTPGIRSVLSGAYPLGSATENTWGCCADEGGSLVPLPMQYRFDVTLDPAADLDPDELNIAEEYRIIGLQSVGPVFNPDDLTTGIDQNNDDVFVAFEYWESDTLHLSVWRYKRHELLTPTWEEVWNDSFTEDFAATTIPRNFMMGVGRTHNSDIATSGQAVIWWVGGGIARMFPDEDDAGNNTTRALPGDVTSPVNDPVQTVFPDMAVGHQGRVVILAFQSMPFGPDTFFAHNEAMYWTAYNDFRTLGSASYGEVTVAPESPVGYGAVNSLSANELLLIKRHGGAVLISGDTDGIGVNSPTSKALPYIKSTGLARCNGTVAPIGFIYPVDGGGVWLWQGGDFCQDVSKLMNGDFWRPPVTDSLGDPVDYGYANTQMAAVNEFALLPNNYILDTAHGTWWRVDDPDLFIAYRWAVDYRSRKAFATPSGFTTVNTPVFKEYDATRLAAKYVWESQPISNTIDTTVALTEICLVASGVGDVEVKVISGQDPTGQTVTFSIDSIVPVAVRRSMTTRGTHIQFTITSTGDDWHDPLTPPSPEDPAPTVHELRYAIAAPNPIQHGGS